MNAGYVDTSCLVAVVFAESSHDRVRKVLREHALTSANLLEAELRSAAAREGVDGLEDILSWVEWLLPLTELSEQIVRVLDAGYLRGADLWHLASALYAAGENPSELPFLTLDEGQRTVAAALGFPTPL